MATYTQLELIGEQLRDLGIAQAEETAERIDPGFNERAFEMFKLWLSGWPRGYRFLIEDFRQSAGFRGLVAPASKRVFGGLAVRAKKEELIKRVGTKQVKNKTAHACFATEWEKL